jgi:ribosomal protein L7Ae-like RNA K-turn-binding protein
MHSMLAALIADARIDVGSSAVVRGCQRAKFGLVLLADDAAPDIVRDVSAAARDAGVRVVRVPSRDELAALIGHRRPTASAGLVLTETEFLNAFSGRPIDWSLDLLIWFHSGRFEHLEAGYKRATLRKGLRRPWALTLGVVDAASAQVRGRIQIAEVRWLHWGALEHSPDILHYEYPSEYPALRDEMLDIYPDLANDTWMTYYRFIYESVSM